MSFFKKLKDRLFRSSSKLEEGIDHIVKNGGLGEPEVGPFPFFRVIQEGDWTRLD